MKLQSVIKFVGLALFLLLLCSPKTGSAKLVEFEIELCSKVFEYKGEAYFCGKHRRYGKELFRSNGTPQGTTVVADIDAGPGGSNPEAFFVLRDKLYFLAETELTGKQIWRTDGTEEGTKRITNAIPASSKLVYGTKILKDSQVVYFRMSDGWWRTDGSSQGTVRITGDSERIAAAYGGSFYYFNRVFLDFQDLGQNIEELKLFKTSINSNQAAEVKNFGVGCSFNQNHDASNAVFNGQLYFLVRCLNGDSDDGFTYFVSDGTRLGTTKLVDGSIEVLGHLNEYRYFYNTASNAIQYSEGVNVLTLRDCNLEQCAGANARYNSLFSGSASMVHNGRLFFHLFDKNFDEQLWSTDGTIEGTLAITDSTAYYYASTSDSLVFIDSEDFGKVWTTDGTASGTERLNFPDGHQAGTVLSLGNRFLIFSDDLATRKTVLWTSTGKPSSTQRLATFTGFQDLEFSAVEGNRFYFPSNGVLWQTNAKQGGTNKVTYLDNVSVARVDWLQAILNFLLDDD